LFTLDVDTAPNITLISPSNASSITNRTPTFAYNGSDAQGDTLTYDINITCLGACPVLDDRNIPGYAQTNYTPTNELRNLYDHGYYYNWSVRACENASLDRLCSNWSSRIVNLSSLIIINLPTNNVNFGSMYIGQNLNTTNDSIPPLVVQNVGNSLFNITINATQMWSTVTNPSDNFTAHIRSFSGNATWANASWFQLPPITGGVVAVSGLNYSTNNNSLKVDISLTVPNSESSGSKGSQINFRADLGE
jgi:hypothetical protein